MSIRLFSLTLLPLLLLAGTADLSAQAPTEEKPISQPNQDQKPETGKETPVQDDKQQDPKEKKAPEPIIIKLAEGNLQFTATGTWETVPVRNNIIAHELKIPGATESSDDEKATEAAQPDGRLTFTNAMGSNDANIDRWKSQFVQPDGSATNDKTKVEKKSIAEQSVTIVDISGTFMDAPGGPFSGAPKVERKGYRMLAAIVETESLGKYFVKFYGPKDLVDKNEEHFNAMLKSLKIVN